jgi:hypothetical protein
MNHDRQHEQHPGMPLPLLDHVHGARVYDTKFLRAAVLFGSLGGVLFGLLGYGFASGVLAIGGLGQWASAGEGPGTVAGASLGAAAGALAGGLMELYRVPARHIKHEQQKRS